MIDPSRQREFTRVPAALGVRVLCEGRSIEGGQSRDISLKGLYVRSSRPLPIGRRCRVEIAALSDLESSPIVVEAEVARTDAEGVGIRFTEITMASYVALTDLVRTLAPDPSRIDGELARPGPLR